MRTLQAEHFAHAGADLGEGPVWDPRHDCIAWVDITAGHVHQTRVDGSKKATVAVGQHVGAALPAEHPGYLLALRAGWGFLTPDRVVEPLDLPAEDDATVRFNDAKCDPRGRAFGGTMAYDMHPGGGMLFRLDEGPVSTPVLTDLTISNGLGWSPDETTMYYIDSATYAITAFAYDADAAALTKRRTLVEFPRAEGMPDGLAVDSDGCVWVALWGSGQVRRYTPKGELDVVVRLPVSQPTSVAFAGPALDLLVVTSARYGVGEPQLADEPHAGDLFAVSGLATGLPTSLWRGLPSQTT